MIHSKVLKAAAAVFLLLLVAGIFCGAAAAGSVASVSADKLMENPSSNITQALQNRVASVDMQQTNSQPDKGFKVNIRGIGTIGNSSPLYVIDGVAGGNLDGINPNDIESIDVLKDAASSAIYGARAANGVILMDKSTGVQESQPGASMQIRIRGQRSLSASNDPLIVLDGIPFNGSLSDINPSDIKSMDILKDASATAIYGSRGANGVILVTTDVPASIQTSASLSGYYGQSNFLTSVLNGIQKAIFGLLTNIFDTFLFL